MARPTSAPGIGQVRLRKKGRFWYARFTHGGKRHEIPLRVTNKVPAEDKARQINDALDGGDPWQWAIGQSHAGSHTFAEVAQEYLDKGSRWADSTRKANLSTVRMLVREFGSFPVTQIDGRMIEAYLARRRDDHQEPLSDGSRNRYLCVLKVILAKGVEWGYAPVNPAAGVTMVPEGRKQPNPIRPDEKDRLLAALLPQHRRIAEIYLQTGMRRGELASLLWGDVDFTAGIVIIRDPKNRRDRTIYMSDRVFQALRERRREWEAESRGTQADLRAFGAAADIRQVLNRAARRAGIEEGRRDRLQHRLRDTFITTMVAEGVPLDRVQVLAGHNNIEMTRRYAETSNESLRQAIAQVFNK